MKITLTKADSEQMLIVIPSSPNSEKQNVIGSTGWDEWMSLVEARLKKLGYRRYSQNLKSEDFAYWKSFYDEDAKIYQIGLFFYDFRKYADRDPMANRISIQYECMLLGRGRVDMSVSKDIDLPEFEKMARTFYEAMWQYCL
jgi:hypothetical protein